MYSFSRLSINDQRNLTFFLETTFLATCQAPPYVGPNLAPKSRFWALDQHGRDLGRQITLEREGRFFAKNHQKIGNTWDSQAILSKNRRFILCRRYIGDFWRKIAQPTYLLHLSCCHPPTRDISAIFRRFFPIFSSLLPSTLGVHK